MTSKSIRQPGADHPIAIESSGKRIVVRAAGRVLADSREALVLREASYSPVFYIPRTDVDMANLTPTERSTYCPYKGDCSYFGIRDAGDRAAHAVWSYEAPYPAVAAIAGHLAFYPNLIDAIEVTDG